MANDNADLANDLRAVATGALTEAAFREKYSEVHSPTLDAIWHGLEHYFADADIRATDPAYDEMQTRELQRLIRRLEEGGSSKDLARVSFLGSSEP